MLDEAFNDLNRPTWTGFNENWQSPEFGPTHNVKLGRLYWPRNASQYAIGRFLATEPELDLIRRKAYQPDSRGVVPLDLVIDDGTNSITTELYMLPPRPIFQWDGDPATRSGEVDTSTNLYLLTLVDERYWWWRKSAAITVSSGQSWETLYTAIGAALGITITVDTIPEAYMSPSQDLTSKYDFLPTLLDAVAYSVGQRICRTLDGDVLAQNAEDGRLAAQSLWETLASDTMAGGDFRFDRVSPHQDLPALVPDRVRVTFPKHETTDEVGPCAADRCATEAYAVDQTLAGLNSTQWPWYNGVMVKSGTKTFHSTAVAWYSGSTLQNSAELSALTVQLATDWYGWQKFGDQARVIAGIVEWTGEATNDYVEWETFPLMRTRVVREAINDLAQQVFHEGTSYSDPSGHSSGTPWNGKITSFKTECEGGYNHRYRQLVLIDYQNGNTQTFPWIFDSVEGCCACYEGGSSTSLPSWWQGSSGPIDYGECVTGTSAGIAFKLPLRMRLQMIWHGEIVMQQTVYYENGPTELSPKWRVLGEEAVSPCSGSYANLVTGFYSLDAVEIVDGVFRLHGLVHDSTPGSVWTITMRATAALPAYGEAFTASGSASLLTYVGVSPKPYCGAVDLDSGVNGFTLKLIGDTCEPGDHPLIPSSSLGWTWHAGPVIASGTVGEIQDDDLGTFCNWQLYDIGSYAYTDPLPLGASVYVSYVDVTLYATGVGPFSLDMFGCFINGDQPPDVAVDYYSGVVVDGQTIRFHINATITDIRFMSVGVNGFCHGFRDIQFYS